MDLSAWEKKTVTLDWAGLKLPLRVAQELFSSHDVDQGTKLLLRSLDPESWPDEPVVLDFGCGYGPLGLAVKARVSGARVVLIDRDALAVAFASWNARELGLTAGAVIHGGLDFRSPHAPDGYDLILWNVPGKAGEPVLHGLVADVPHAMRPGGLLALVVVNPLADVIRDTVASHQSLSVTHDQQHTAHTVMHVRQEVHGERQWPRPPAFDRGVFDRPEEEPTRHGDFYLLKSVFGLPEYDVLDYTSALLMETLDSWVADGSRVDQLLIQNVGQGHAAIHAARRLEPDRSVLVDRDLLALQATRRNLTTNEVLCSNIHIVHSPVLEASQDDEHRADFILARLESQLSSPQVNLLHSRFLAALATAGTLIVSGPSTSVSRFLATSSKAGQLRPQTRRRRSGASVTVLRRH
jgi:16S rRNA (guanine1207-N2)-methyltransferase